MSPITATKSWRKRRWNNSSYREVPWNWIEQSRTTRNFPGFLLMIYAVMWYLPNLSFRSSEINVGNLFSEAICDHSRTYCGFRPVGPIIAQPNITLVAYGPPSTAGITSLGWRASGTSAPTYNSTWESNFGRCTWRGRCGNYSTSCSGISSLATAIVEDCHQIQGRVFWAVCFLCRCLIIFSNTRFCWWQVLNKLDHSVRICQRPGLNWLQYFLGRVPFLVVGLAFVGQDYLPQL